MAEDRIADEELDHERRNDPNHDQSHSDDGPTRGTYADNGHAGVKMADGKVVATDTAEEDDIRKDGLADQLDVPDAPDAEVPGSVLSDQDEGRGTSTGQGH